MTNFDRLHQQVLQLRKKRAFDSIHDLLRPIDEDELLGMPELSLALASALSYLRRHAESKRLLLASEAPIILSTNSEYLRRWQLLLAIQLIEEGLLDQAERLLVTSLEASERASDSRLIADNNNTLGVLRSLRGEIDRAVAHFNRSLFAWQSLGDSQGVGIAHYNLGLLLREWGNPIAALPHFVHADDYFTREGIIEERVFVGAERALLFSDLGDYSFAEHLARAAVDKSREVVAVGIQSAALRALGAVLTKQGKYCESKQTLLKSLEILGDHNAGVIRAEVCEELAIVSIDLEKLDSAFDYLTKAGAEYMRIGSINHYQRLQRRFAACRTQREGLRSADSPYLEG